MPHKHKRKREEDESNFDLPPTSRARTLSVHQKSEPIFTSDADKKRAQEVRKQQRKKNKKGNSNDEGHFEDDTPKAFRRLMSFQPGGKRIPSGLDDGNTSKKKQRQKQKREDKVTPRSTSASSKPEGRNATTTASTEPSNPPAPDTTTKAAKNNTIIPHILPGESLAAYSQRVDQSLPLTSIPKHRTRLNTIPGLEKIKTPLTKHNKRLARMQQEWRATEQRLREKQEEEDEERAERREEDEILWLGAGIDPAKQVVTLSKGGGKKAKKRRKGGAGGAGGRVVDVDDDADPWKILEKKRREEGQLGRQVNLQDVVAAPPILKPVKNIFKEKPQRTTTGAISVV
ncbi:hypothetical protein AYL99_01944 [Fonsecaea erecta]|uniref:Urease accessory protein UreD n=1 Tax=Fonsecaea erecta TaxID=1367422 RepID=A0A178ZSC9_9EURO|nr:hypothetical protein AYL99_01944 [Fonsecaea erecta]OAP62717.1 hypothetical protein AYL99_01944 [Fonsecaea erecta]